MTLFHVRPGAKAPEAPSWEIFTAADGKVAEVYSIVFAYRLIELLNLEHTIVDYRARHNDNSTTLEGDGV